MGRKISSIGSNRSREEIAGDVVDVRNKMELGAGAIGRGRALALVLELLLDVRDLLVEVNSKL